MYTDKSLKCYVHNVLFKLNMIFTIFGNYNLSKGYSKLRISFGGIPGPVFKISIWGGISSDIQTEIT